MTRARSRWWIWLVGLGLYAAFGVGLVTYASGAECVGDCFGRPIDCAGLEAWTSRARADPSAFAGPHGAPRHRGRIPFLAGRPCGLYGVGIFARDVSIGAAVEHAQHTAGTLGLTLALVDVRSGHVVFRAVGLEVSRFDRFLEAWRTR